ncbi:MAG: discoidin domain-containing protein, partial [Trebonia sp.]
MQYTGTQYTAAGQQGAAGYQAKRRGGASRMMVTAVAIVVLAVLGVVVWLVGFNKSGPPTASAGTQPTTSTSAPTAGTMLNIASDTTFNPYGTPPGNTENPSTAKAAVDGNPSTAWHTSYYLNNPKMAGLKPGTGLLIDMGKEVKLSQVEVLFSSDGGPTTASVYLGNNPADTKATALSNFTLVSPSASVSGDHKFPVSSQATGRYVLIWLTSLPKLSKAPQGASGGNAYYEGRLFNVVVRGSAVSGNS